MEITFTNIKKILVITLWCVSPTIAFSAQEGVVAVEGAMVYKSADFDSTVINYLSRGEKLPISSKPFGAFHRVRLKSGVIGYMADTDLLSVDGRPLSEINSGKSLDTKKTSVRKKQGQERLSPVGVTQGIGLNLGFLNYRELLNRRDFSENLMFLGLQYASRASFIDGSFGMEADLLYYHGAPSYYNSPTTTAAGHIAIMDFILTYAVANFLEQNGAFTIGAGPMLALSYIQADPTSYNRTDMGIVMNGSLSYRTHPLILKFEPRYYIEKNTYVGYHFVLLYAFQ
ncbi:MAG: hypothetical protein AB7F59_04870 [Bdellovibrionales bacterium]